jgi:phosphatidylinositol-3-phosphatase
VIGTAGDENGELPSDSRGSHRLTPRECGNDHPADATHRSLRMRTPFLATVIVFTLLAAAAVAADPNAKSAPWIQWPKGLPVYDHVVIVVEENKDYDEIIGNAAAPYFNNVLKPEGANFLQMYSEEHFSQGNYFWMFAGSNFDIGFDDVLPTTSNPFGYPFKAGNLASGLIEKGRQFKGYSENLPAIGSTVEYVYQDQEKIYGRKHVPWISFANVPNGTTPETSSNLRWDDFPANAAQYATLPTVAFVIPNLINDMHNGGIETSIPIGDQWLRNKLDGYYQWAKTHNSLLIVTFDESDDNSNYAGLTNPSVKPPDKLRRHVPLTPIEQLQLDLQNRIVTIFAGAHIKAGDYLEGHGITHVNVLRTLEAMYGLPKSGRQQPNAAGIGITDDYIITDVFDHSL